MEMVEPSLFFYIKKYKFLKELVRGWKIRNS